MSGKSQRTQESRILWLLQASWPNWTASPSLAQISLQYNARIHALRAKGWLIESKVVTQNGVRHGSYRLARPSTFPRTEAPSRTGCTSHPAGAAGSGHGHRGTAAPPSSSAELFSHEELERTRRQEYPD
jgi:hypothetical protein